MVSTTTTTARYGAKNAKPCSPATYARGRNHSAFMAPAAIQPGVIGTLEIPAESTRISGRVDPSRKDFRFMPGGRCLSDYASFYPLGTRFDCVSSQLLRSALASTGPNDLLDRGT